MAAKTKENMDENDSNNCPLKLRKYFEHDVKQKSDDDLRDILEIKYEKLEVDFQVKSLQAMSVEDYKDRVETLQKRFGLKKVAKESFLDILSSKKTGENFKKFSYNDGEGKAYDGLFVVEVKDGKIDLSYAIRSVDFKFEEMEYWVFTWWSIFPTGWEYKKKPLTLNSSQEKKFYEWFKSEFNKQTMEEIKKIELFE